jgi:hypothetical protein
MSDNDKYAVSVSVWYDGLVGFIISSKDKVISPEFLAKAKKHLVEDLGFNPEMFYESDYSEC